MEKLIKCDLCEDDAVWSNRAYSNEEDIKYTCDKHYSNACDHNECKSYTECLHSAWRYNLRGWAFVEEYMIKSLGKNNTSMPIGSTRGLDFKP